MAKRGGFPGGMGGFGGMNLNNLMKEAKKMQADMQKTQEELASKEFEASAGGGAINVKVTGEKVIIENQLEASNHDHLGKIITYASGLDANVIVWIVKEAREEHRSAIEWLNNNTATNINFFLIEVHAYQIGDSLYAPKFEVVEKPNGFIKNAKTQSGSGEYNRSQSERLEFWNRFNEIVAERGKPFNVRKASTDHWYDIAIGVLSLIHI